MRAVSFWLSLSLVLGLLCGGPVAPAHAAAQYTIVDLGAGESVARLIVYHGVLTAVGQLAQQAVLVQQGSPPHLLGFLPGGTFSQLGGGGPEALVGLSGTGQFSLETHAMLIEGGHLRDLGTLGSPALFSAATGLSPTLVIGYCSSTDSPSVPCIWARPHGSAQALPTLGGGRGRLAAINAADQIVGQSQTTSGDEHATLWIGGLPHDLTPGTGMFSDATDMNHGGVVVGRQGQDAMRWSPPAYLPENLGRFPGDVAAWLEAVNDAGLAVGTSAPPCPTGQFCAPNRAIRVQGTTIDDLNTLVNAPGWVLEAAMGVSTTGAIAGIGTFQGAGHAWLLLPKQSARRHDEGR